MPRRPARPILLPGGRTERRSERSVGSQTAPIPPITAFNLSLKRGFPTDRNSWVPILGPSRLIIRATVLTIRRPAANIRRIRDIVIWTAGCPALTGGSVLSEAPYGGFLLRWYGRVRRRQFSTPFSEGGKQAGFSRRK